MSKDHLQTPEYNRMLQDQTWLRDNHTFRYYVCPDNARIEEMWKFPIPVTVTLFTSAWYITLTDPSWDLFRISILMISILMIHWLDPKPKMVIGYLESVLCNFSVPWHRCCIACTAPVRFATALVWISLLCQRLTVPVLPYSNRNDTAGAPSPCNRTVLHDHFRACTFWGSCDICATPVETHLPALLYMYGFYKKPKICRQ